MGMALIKISTLSILAGPWGYGKTGVAMAIKEVFPMWSEVLPVDEPDVAIAWDSWDAALVPYVDQYATLGINQEYDLNNKTYTVTIHSVVGFVPAINIPMATLIAPTDYKMARGFEDFIPVLISKGCISISDIPSPVLANINERRAIRGEPTLS